MCGVFGLVWRPDAIATSQVARAAIDAMGTATAHRGPDGTGLAERTGVMLGHHRLAIIDVEAGAQPMCAQNGAVALSYNGEVYNFQELRRDLADRGWQFTTRSDSETVLAGYCLDGVGFDARLNGMYGYAILDERTEDRSIVLSIDPMGIKPMFLWQGDGITLFASELRAIVQGLKALGQTVTTDARAVAAYLRLGWVPGPLSMIEGAKRLLPGERWVIDVRSAEARLHSTRPWPSTAERPRDEREFGAVFSAALKEAITRQMISDVPLGFFLSGGIDSSLLVAVAREQGRDPASFTIRFSGDGHGVEAANEAEVARAVADKLGTPFNCIDVDESTIRGTLERTLSSMDQPLADPACLPLLLLSEFAREQVKVCISGDGGDELFAGYPRHALAPARATWRRLPPSLKAIGGRIAGLLPEAPSTGLAEVSRKARVAYALLDAEEYISGPFADSVAPDRSLEPWNYDARSDAYALMRADFDGQLVGQMLPKTDNMTMAASLECRVPFLDLELVSLAATAPIAWKRHGRIGKVPLRNELARYLPREITGRPKHGFRVPLTSWFRGSMANEIQDRVASREDMFDEVLGEGVARTTVETHLAGRAEHSVRIWALLALDNWLARLESGAARS
ncbi:asparagine synthase (glutamine-hydrolyzing) [Tsuneonella sp. HG249]